VTGPVVVTPEVLARHPLPDHADATSKRDRGDVLVVGGTAETPGAVLLAGVAALRAGAGRLKIATAAEAAPGLAVQVPEARVIGLDGDDDRLAPDLEQATAVLLGPGTFGPDATRRLAARAVEVLAGTDGVLVLDAGSLELLAGEADLLAPLGARAVAMPNPGEAAAILGADEVDEDGLADVLTTLVDRCRCVVTVRGDDTWTAGPGTAHHVDRSGCVGLATCGSGDVLAGIVAGLAAQGVDALGAVLWATQAHGWAGHRCADRWGPVGFLARDLLDQVGPALDALAGAR
jgi:ADP-dependent NAD(P)H-hydrate dehydratase